MKWITHGMIVSVIALCQLTACRQSPAAISPSDGGNGDEALSPDVEYISQKITISDGVNSKVLTLGTGEKLTKGFDTGIDVEAPPFDPPGSFYAYYENGDYNFFKDIRAKSDDKMIWTLDYSAQEGESIEISWELSDEMANTGTLRLVDNPDNPEVAVDMASKENYSPADKQGKLYLIYNTGQSAQNKISANSASNSSLRQKSSGDTDTKVPEKLDADAIHHPQKVNR